MKIERILIKRHKILGDLNLTFLDTNGNVCNTVIFAGENGCGKTTILSLIFNILSVGFLSGEASNIYYKIEFLLENNDLNIIIDNYKNNSNNYQYSKELNLSLCNKIVIEVDNHICKNIIFYDNKENTIINTLDDANIDKILILNVIHKIIKVYYQTAEISFSISEKTNITSLKLDDENYSYLISDKKFPDKFAQLLIDIDTQDAREVRDWIRKNNNQIPPNELMYRRINRFNTAFAKIFDHLQFKTIDTNEGKQSILFSSYGNDVELNNLSGGEKQIIFRGGFFLSNRNNISNTIAFIDEPELALHPRWQKNILSYYREILTNNDQMAQIFIATHSPFVVHSQQENTKYIIFKKDINGKIIIMNKAEFPKFSEDEVVEEAFDIKLYKDSENAIIFVEDCMHTKILSELLKGKKIQIIQIGTCKSVLKCAEVLGYKENIFFIVDGDNIKLESNIYGNNVCKLSKYCIENYFLDELLFDRVLKYLKVNKTAEECLKEAVKSYNPANTKFDSLKTLFKHNLFSFNCDELNTVDGSELIKQISSNKVLNLKNEYELVEIFIQQAQKLNIFTKLFKEILDFLNM